MKPALFAALLFVLSNVNADTVAIEKLDDAIAAGQSINLGTLPLAGFLGETLEIVVAEPEAE